MAAKLLEIDGDANQEEGENTGQEKTIGLG